MERRHPRKFDMPKDAARFASVAETIRTQGRPAGFALARDLMFTEYEQLDEIPAAARIKLAIELDKHSMFSETFASKGQASTGDWQQLQQYLNFQTDVVPSTTATITPKGTIKVEQAPTVDTDDLDDGGATDDGD